MLHALELAKRGLGTTWPNPSVGCVIVQGDVVVGRGFTQPAGRPHAETQALAMAGEKARGATVYVTLEPCAHHGKTPPCAEALIKAGVAKVVIAHTDPHPQVSGKGIAMLNEAGIIVEVGMCEAEAFRINQGFFYTQTKGRPLVTLKLATSLDGKIATHNGESRWITSEASRRYAHKLRAEYDAILVGSGTVREDTPTLTCRLPGLESRSPVRVMLDAQHSCDRTTIAGDAPLWWVGKDGEIPLHTDAHGHIPPEALCKALAEKGITRLLIEGGGKLAASFLRAKLVDRLIWFHAPLILGNDARAGVAEMDYAALAEAARFSVVASRALGEDRVIELDTLS
jgi:diaminohydroxyphosphoribosylaminopyrimidine deaminase/5-amino-6-(5-phosphoribosylamino)uracil reductase